MPYRLIRGQFRLFYPADGGDCSGPRPDGDTIRFEPDDPNLVLGLAQFGGSPAEFKRGTGVNIRLEAVDALETHFNEFRQHPELAEASRALLLEALGFTGIDSCPNGAVRGADQDATRGAILANGVDRHGRVVAFVYDEGGAPRAGTIDGTEVRIGAPELDASVNRRLLADGQAYPAWFDTLPAELRDELAPVSRAARAAGSGLWAEAVGHPGADPAPIGNAADIQELAIVPVMFRRLMAYRDSVEGASGLRNWDAWLRRDLERDAPIMLVPTADPIVGGDGMIRLRPGEVGNLHDILLADVDDGTMRLAVDPEDYIRLDTPPGQSAPPEMIVEVGQASGLRIVASLANPAGDDTGQETVTVINVTPEPIDVTGWRLTDAQAQRFDVLAGTVAAGDTMRIVLVNVQLGNRGDAIVLLGPAGDDTVVDRVEYTASDVAVQGATLVF